MNNQGTEALTLKETLSQHGFAVVQGKGTSMLPLIANTRDRMCIKPLDREPKKYDILVYSNPHGIIAHRAMKREKDGTLIMCGDNQIRTEVLKPEAVIGYVHGILRGEKYIDFSKPIWYKIYIRLWCASLFLRRCALFVLRRTSKIYKTEIAYMRAQG